MTFDSPARMQHPPLPAMPLETPPVEAPEREHAKAPPRELPFASVAFGSAAILLITLMVAINLASTGSPVAATVLAQLLNWLTIIPFALGVIALVRGPHRGWAIAAMMVSVIANPFILRTVLSFFGSL